MAKTKRLYILATCFLSGAAAIISFVALGTQYWVLASPKATEDPTSNMGDSMRIGLFGGVFSQVMGSPIVLQLTTVCAYDLNICAALCGENMKDNLRKLYDGRDSEIPEADRLKCPTISDQYGSYDVKIRASSDSNEERIFINAGVWLCTVIFLIISGVMGIFSAGLAVWNTATSPVQVYLSIFGLYIYNGIAFFSILLSIILWGVMYSQDLISNIPSYKTFLEDFTTKNQSQLGYSYWINLASLFLYLVSICLLYIRNYLISKEPEVNVHIEDDADPVIYLY